MQHRVIVGVNLVLVRGDHVLLGLRRNTGWANGRWYFPAGRLEEGESVLHGMAREAREELSIGIAPEHLCLFHTLHHPAADQGKGWLQLYFTASRYTGHVTNAEPSRCEEVRWWPIGGPPPAQSVPYVAPVLEALAARRRLTVLASDVRRIA
ncbi:NUDIX domain-containing protein [Streptomyces indicus]|uniref:ADP-ribose pyrophosphatase YjhB, NUDIX family n=1 Tax=Streptomyces indicus TaxID=417292 RepID=A0A1G8W9J6_9ACTN|nr:NUDIX domain-containing protein [Streptomyces indicus]SDJ74938.1 ADP-ribose pyrophosphatase YjhB, NUDIX family [Streptomyces indicus]